VSREDARGLLSKILKSSALWAFAASLPFYRRKKNAAAA